MYKHKKVFIIFKTILYTFKNLLLKKILSVTKNIKLTFIQLIKFDFKYFYTMKSTYIKIFRFEPMPAHFINFISELKN